MTLGVLYKVAADGAPSKVLFSGERLPRETFQALRSADTVLHEAEAQAQRLREQGAALLEAQKQKAQSEGFRHGQAEGLAGVLGTLEVERCLRDLLSSRLADVVEHCLRGLVGEPDDQGVLRQRILHLLRSAGESSTSLSAAASPLGGATLYVCPEQLPSVQAVVSQLKAELAQAYGRHGGDPEAQAFSSLQVVADPQRATDSLLLETRLAFIESSVELTLQEARSLVQRSIHRAVQQLDSLA